MGEQFLVNSANVEKFLDKARELTDNHHQVLFEWHLSKTRTSRQSRALHLWMSRFADWLFAHGLDLNLECAIFRKPIQRQFTGEDVKNLIWKPVQMALFPEKKSNDSHFEWPSVDDVLGVLKDLNRKRPLHQEFKRIESQPVSLEQHEKYMAELRAILNG